MYPACERWVVSVVVLFQVTTGSTGWFLSSEPEYRPQYNYHMRGPRSGFALVRVPNYVGGGLRVVKPPDLSSEYRHITKSPDPILDPRLVVRPHEPVLDHRLVVKPQDPLLDSQPFVDLRKHKTQTFFKAELLQPESPTYEFGYRVHDPKEKNYQQKTETRIGDAVKGFYSVLEPNGYVRMVKYKSDENGFQTQVSHHHADDNGGSYSSYSMSRQRR